MSLANLATSSTQIFAGFCCYLCQSSRACWTALLSCKRVCKSHACVLQTGISSHAMAAKVLLLATCYALVAPSQPTKTKLRAATLEEVERIPTPAFGKTFGDDVSKLKAAIFHFGATLDRGQGFNPTTGEQYKDRMDRAVSAVEALCATGTPDVTPEKLKGRWELVFSSVPHGIFRISPFFEAIYDSYANVGKPDKAELVLQA